jgi:hypothetical protein
MKAGEVLRDLLLATPEGDQSLLDFIRCLRSRGHSWGLRTPFQGACRQGPRQSCRSQLTDSLQCRNGEFVPRAAASSGRGSTGPK